jgi:hypothetical protein
MKPDFRADDPKPDESQASAREKSDRKMSSPRTDRLLETNIGKVVGGVEAAQRFKHLLAKTLKLTNMD